MSKQPLNVYVVEDYESAGETRQLWTKVGTAFPHNDGQGFSIIIRSGLSVSGRVTVRERKPEEAQGDN